MFRLLSQKSQPLRWLLLILLIPAGCSWLGKRVDLPREKRFFDEQISIYSEIELTPQQEVLDSLQLVRLDLERRLGLPKSERAVSVYLFENPKRFDRYINRSHPEFPDRQAFFVKDGANLTVYAAWSDEADIDLRHEVTHGYLHSVLPSLPLWIDEGLAEYYEVPRSLEGRHLDHAKFLLRRFHEGTWRPNLNALEQRQTSAEMLQIDYAEAWLWTHWILSDYRPDVRLSSSNRCSQLASYLAKLSNGETVAPYSQQFEDLESIHFELIHHLNQLL